jgi:Flp pilus assembly protein TadD
MLIHGQPSSRNFFRVLTLVLFILVAVGGALVWYLNKAADRFACDSIPPTSLDPRVAYEGPFRNIHPGVSTVGNAKCAVCHPEIAKQYANHPMGMSILPISSQTVGDLTAQGKVSFAALGSQFKLEHAGDRLWYTEKRKAQDGEVLFEIRGEINYIIGSGTKGHSFLSVNDGFARQTAVSWFNQKHIWDESPGFPPDLHIGRPVQVECLYCHANPVVPVKGTLNRYDLPLFHDSPAIGCERCHGPGEEHVKLRESNQSIDTPDYSIVNPGHLDPPLREAVCQQCHLAGEARIVRMGRSMNDFRPGLPLDSVMHVLVRDHRGQDRKAVNHVEQMYQSKCFIKSGGSLGCITCHNPHEKASVEKRAERYRNACLKCHDCSSPLETRAKLGAPDNCISCHMPQFAASDIVHAATTDHRIARKRELSKSIEASSKTGTHPLLFFPWKQPELRNVSEAADYAIGLIEMAREGKVSGVEVAREALSILERTIAEMPDDYRTWEAKSYALIYSGRKSEGLAAAQKVVSLFPNYESGLIRAAILENEAGQNEQSGKHFRKAIDLNPGNAMYREELANLLTKIGEWQNALTEAEEAVRLDPGRTTARTILAIAYFRAGKKAKANELFRSVELLNPPNLSQLRQRYTAERTFP